MKTYFIIINYNDYKTTLNLLKNIESYSILDKIIVVDNDSPNLDFDILKENENEKIKVIKNNQNNGYSSGINYALKTIEGDANIIISNPDIIINSEKDLEKLLFHLQNYAVVAPTINEHGNLNRGWKIPTSYQDILLNIPVLYKKIEKKLNYPDVYYQNDLVEVEAVSGCFFLAKLSVLREIDYFDENVFLYYEENILATKLKKKNQKTVVDTTVTIIHDHSVTVDKNINHYKKYKILKQSEYYFEKKYNHANFFEKILLKLTIWIGLFIQYIRGVL